MRHALLLCTGAAFGFACALPLLRDKDPPAEPWQLAVVFFASVFGARLLLLWAESDHERKTCRYCKEALDEQLEYAGEVPTPCKPG